MNHLAHFLLADPTPASLVGNFLGDFVKGSDLTGFDEEIRAGILRHRKIDAFTDAHAVVRDAKRRFSPDRRRFAGIILDVAYDHFLAKNWDRYGPLSLETFTRQIYTALTQHRHLLPHSVRAALPAMIERDWLAAYRDLAATGHALDRIAGRLRRPNRFAGAGAEVLARYADLEAGFHTFFPELTAYAQTCPEKHHA